MTGQFDYLHEAGTLRGVVFHIGVRADPTLNAVDSFAAILFFRNADGEDIEVAKIDNTEHRDGTIHIDRYYREQGTDEMDFSVDADGVWDADKYLEDNWAHFARTYLDNHGERERRT